jgi:hypothetical protein
MGRNNGTYRATAFRPQQNGHAETEADAGAGGVGRGGNSYRRDFRPPQSGLADRNGGGGANGGSGASSDSSNFKGQATDLPAVKENGTDMPGMISGLEKRLSGVQQDFTQAIHKISEKENEKFDLIFAILSELQSRQAQLEESVRSLKAQYGNGHMVSNGSQPPQQQFGSSGGPGQFGQMNGQMNGQMGMNGNMGNQQPMQQFAGVTMNPDGTQAMMMQPMTQMMIVSSPTNGNMQYVAPQMMTPTGAVVQPMPAHGDAVRRARFWPRDGNAVCEWTGSIGLARAGADEHASSEW